MECADKNIRNNVFGLEIEVEFVPIYKDQPLFSDIDTFLRRFGFHLFDLRPFYWKRLDGTAFGRPKGQIIFADVLYLKDTQGLQYILSKISDNTLKKSKVLRAVSICIVYGYLDYALEIFKANGALFTKSESEDFTGRLNSEVMLAHKFPNFRGRSRIADILYSIYKVVHPSGRGWVFRDRTLGNIE